MSEIEFWESTPRHFAARQKAFLMAERSEWERARFIGWLSILPYVAEGKEPKATDLYRFDWDPAEEIQGRDLEAESDALRQFEHDARLIFEKRFGIKFEGNTEDANN